jgi:hypothetical protein
MNVWTPDGVCHRVTVRVDAAYCVMQVKENIHLALGIPPDKQRLFYGKVLL